MLLPPGTLTAWLVPMGTPPHVVLAILGVVAGCNSSVSVDETDGGLGGSAAAAPKGGSNAGGTSNEGGTMEGGGPPSDICASYDDESALSSLTIRIHNDTGAPIYIPGNCSVPQYGLTSKAGATDVTYPYSSGCNLSCEDRQNYVGDIDCSACAPSAIVINHGDSYAFTWDGTGVRFENMPASCWKKFSPGETCPRRLVAPTGDYFVDVTAFTDCEGWDNTSDCTCEEGVCAGTASGIVGIPDNPSITYPSAGIAELHFGPCAFGCPVDAP